MANVADSVQERWWRVREAEVGVGNVAMKKNTRR